MFDKLKKFVKAPFADNVKLASENAELKAELEKLKNNYETLSSCYESLSQKYFSLLSNASGRFPEMRDSQKETLLKLSKVK